MNWSDPPGYRETCAAMKEPRSFIAILKKQKTHALINVTIESKNLKEAIEKVKEDYAGHSIIKLTENKGLWD
jgi:hypothetical protein